MGYFTDWANLDYIKSLFGMEGGRKRRGEPTAPPATTTTTTFRTSTSTTTITTTTTTTPATTSTLLTTGTPAITSTTTRTTTTTANPNGSTTTTTSTSTRAATTSTATTAAASTTLTSTTTSTTATTTSPATSTSTESSTTSFTDSSGNPTTTTTSTTTKNGITTASSTTTETTSTATDTTTFTGTFTTTSTTGSTTTKEIDTTTTTSTGETTESTTTTTTKDASGTTTSQAGTTVRTDPSTSTTTTTTAKRTTDGISTTTATTTADGRTTTSSAFDFTTPQISTISQSFTGGPTNAPKSADEGNSSRGTSSAVPIAAAAGAVALVGALVVGVFVWKRRKNRTTPIAKTVTKIAAEESQMYANPIYRKRDAAQVGSENAKEITQEQLAELGVGNSEFSDKRILAAELHNLGMRSKDGFKVTTAIGGQEVLNQNFSHNLRILSKVWRFKVEQDPTLKGKNFKKESSYYRVHAINARLAITQSEESFQKAVDEYNNHFRKRKLVLRVDASKTVVAKDHVALDLSAAGRDAPDIDDVPTYATVNKPGAQMNTQKDTFESNTDDKPQVQDGTGFYSVVALDAAQDQLTSYSPNKQDFYNPLAATDAASNDPIYEDGGARKLGNENNKDSGNETDDEEERQFLENIKDQEQQSVQEVPARQLETGEINFISDDRDENNLDNDDRKDSVVNLGGKIGTVNRQGFVIVPGYVETADKLYPNEYDIPQSQQKQADTAAKPKNLPPKPLTRSAATHLKSAPPQSVHYAASYVATATHAAQNNAVADLPTDGQGYLKPTSPNNADSSDYSDAADVIITFNRQLKPDQDYEIPVSANHYTGIAGEENASRQLPLSNASQKQEFYSPFSGDSKSADVDPSALYGDAGVRGVKGVKGQQPSGKPKLQSNPNDLYSQPAKVKKDGGGKGIGEQ